MNKYKLLLAEDDPNLGEILKDYLELKGKFDVVLAVNGEDALQSFNREKFDLCILDVMMPKKDGFTLAKDIRRFNEDIPIIFATAKGMMEDKSAAYGLGGDDYITKPFRVEELLLRINALLKRVSSNDADGADPLPSTFTIGDYYFDYTNQYLTYKDHKQKLQQKRQSF